MAKTIITYGTFDLFHVGHLRLLRRAKGLGDHLIVGISTDEFNETKGKKTIVSYDQRAEIVSAIGCVDKVIAETSWLQKREDIKRYSVNVLVMGSDWAGKFDENKDICEVVYLPRTDGISSTEIKRLLAPLTRERVDDLRLALETIEAIVSQIS